MYSQSSCFFFLYEKVNHVFNFYSLLKISFGRIDLNLPKKLLFFSLEIHGKVSSQNFSLSKCYEKRLSNQCIENQLYWLILGVFLLTPSLKWIFFLRKNNFFVSFLIRVIFELTIYLLSFNSFKNFCCFWVSAFSYKANWTKTTRGRENN